MNKINIKTQDEIKAKDDKNDKKEFNDLAI